jgi:hypothetical protein
MTSKSSRRRFVAWTMSAAVGLGLGARNTPVDAEGAARRMPKRDLEIMAACVRATVRRFPDPKPCAWIDELDGSGHVTGRPDEGLTDQLTTQVRMKWPQYCTGRTDPGRSLSLTPLWWTDNVAHMNFMYSGCEARRTWYGRWKVRTFPRD